MNISTKISILQKKTFVEIIDRHVLEQLINDTDKHQTWQDQSGSTRSDKQDLIQIRDNLNGNKLHVEYAGSFKGSSGFGRLYPKGGVSIGSLRRELRGTLAKDNILPLLVSSL